MSAETKPLRRWEYKTIKLSEHLSSLLHQPYVDDLAVGALSAAGAEGWEFCAVIMRPDSMKHALLKREVTP